MIAYSTYNNRKESATFVLGQSADMVLTHQNSAEANGVTLAAVAADGTQRLYGRAGEQVNEVYLVPKPQRSSRRWGDPVHSVNLDVRIAGVAYDVGYNLPDDYEDYEWLVRITDSNVNSPEAGLRSRQVFDGFEFTGLYSVAAGDFYTRYSTRPLFRL